MNTMNKILLAIIVATATNQTFTSEAGGNKTSSNSIVVTQTPAQKFEEKKLAQKAVDLDIETVDTNIKKLVNDLRDKKLDEKTISLDPELVVLKETAAALKLKKEKVDADLHVAWEEAKPWVATAYKYATGIGLGGFLITKFDLTGNKATFVKGLSFVTAVAVTAFLLDQGYNYFFKEEVENEDVF